MNLRANPVVDRRRPRRAVCWAVGALLAVTAIAGCQTLSAWSMLMVGNSDYANMSDYPDPCASLMPSMPPAYHHGEATVTTTDKTFKALKLTLEEGQFGPGGSDPTGVCQDGTNASYTDASGALMLDISLPDNGAATPSAPRVVVFLVRQDGMNATGIEAPDCAASLTSIKASLLAGTITCKGVSWTDMGSGANPSPGSRPFDLTITFTATP